MLEYPVCCSSHRTVLHRLGHALDTTWTCPGHGLRPVAGSCASWLPAPPGWDMSYHIMCCTISYHVLHDIISCIIWILTQ